MASAGTLLKLLSYANVALAVGRSLATRSKTQLDKIEAAVHFPFSLKNIPEMCLTGLSHAPYLKCYFIK
jgi:hypothetical protein